VQRYQSRAATTESDKPPWCEQRRSARFRTHEAVRIPPILVDCARLSARTVHPTPD
jgi:hypothetical protein